VEPSALLDATAYDEGCRVAVEAFSDSCLGAAFGQKRIHGRPHVRFITASDNSETYQTDELGAVGGQEGVDLDHANTTPTFQASRVSAARGAASEVGRNTLNSEPTKGLGQAWVADDALPPSTRRTVATSAFGSNGSAK